MNVKTNSIILHREVQWINKMKNKCLSQDCQIENTSKQIPFVQYFYFKAVMINMWEPPTAFGAVREKERETMLIWVSKR